MANENGVNKTAKLVGILVGSLTLLSSLGLAYPKIRGLATQEDLTEIRAEVEVLDWHQSVLNGKIDCVLLQVDYNQCPAVEREKRGPRR